MITLPDVQYRAGYWPAQPDKTVYRCLACGRQFHDMWLFAGHRCPPISRRPSSMVQPCGRRIR